MTDHRAVHVTTPSAREIAIARVFDAPRALVYDAYVNPEMLRRWFGLFAGWSLAVCEVDPRVGGACRYVWRRADGSEMSMTQVIEELDAPSRIVAREHYEVPWYDGGALGTVAFDEQDGRTTLTLTMRYESNEARDAVLATDLTRGMNASFDRLTNLLETLPGGERVHDAGVRP